VWSKFESPGFPHFLNQAPPRAQQLGLPEFVMVPHLAHMGLTIIVVGMVQVFVAMECALRLQDWMPCVHVWSKFESSGFPHLLNQAPPRAQQLRVPEFLKLLHLVHFEPTVVVVSVTTVGVVMACGIRLQAWMPCDHVWSKFESLGFPQLLNQAPPRAQQLSLPEFLTIPHLAHTGPFAVVVGAVQMRVVMGTVVPGLQIWTPCVHVWPKFETPAFPHLLNHAPPGAQQLRLPDFFRVPHLVHMGLTVAVVRFALVGVVVACAMSNLQTWTPCVHV